MARSANVRHYNFPDSQFIQLVDSFCRMAERDATKLLEYGFGAADLAQLRNARDAFSDYPADVEISADYYSNTQLRDKLYSDLSLALRQICTRAQFAYGIHSSSYRHFFLGNLSKYSPDQLIRASTHICTQATAQLPTLAPQGLTAPIIAATLATTTQLDDCLNARFTLALAREAATLRRIELGNALYALLLTLSDKGKLCYPDTSMALHRHYNITDDTVSRETSTDEE